MKKWLGKKDNSKKINKSTVNSSAWQTEDIFTGTQTATSFENPIVDKSVINNNNIINGISLNIPFFNRMSSKKQKIVSLSLLTVCFLSLFGTIYMNQGKDNTPYIKNSINQINSLLDRTKDNIHPALKGNNDSIIELKTIEVQASQNINSLNTLVEQNNISSVSSIKENWSQISSAINELYVNKDLLVNEKLDITNTNNQLSTLIKEIQSLINKNKNVNDWYFYNNLLVNLQNLYINGTLFLDTDKSNNIEISTNIWNLNNTINNFLEVSSKNSNLTQPTLDFISNINNHYSNISNQINTVINNVVKTNKMSVSYDNINKLIITNKYNLNALNASYNIISDYNSSSKYLIIILSILSILSLILTIIIFNNNENRYSNMLNINNYLLKASLESMSRDLSIIEKGNLLNKVNITKKDNNLMVKFKDQINELIAIFRKKIVEVYDSNEDAIMNIKGIKDLLNENKRKERESSEESSSIKNQINNLNVVLNNFESKIDNLLINNLAEDMNKTNNNIKLISNNSGEIIENLESTTLRIQRILDSSNKIEENVELLLELAQRISLLSTQAALQAAKKTGNNKGFSLISEEMREVSDKVNVHIQKIKALSSTTHTDINLTKDTTININKKVNEIAWNNDIISNELIIIKDKQQEKNEEIESIKVSLNILSKSLNETKLNLTDLVNKNNKSNTGDIIKNIENIASVLNISKKALEDYNVNKESKNHDDFYPHDYE